MLKSKNVRIMLFLFVVMFVFTFVLGCDDTGGYVDDATEWGNDLADTIDDTCEDAGIPRQASGEIYEALEKAVGQ